MEKVIKWYTSIEAVSYLATLVFGSALGFCLSMLLLINTGAEDNELVYNLSKITIFLIFVSAVLRSITIILIRKK